ncbi:MAG: hypothetical protein U0271_46845 [Polyangiaceae bacterium]
MAANSLDRFVERVTAAWGPPTTETVEQCRTALEDLARSDVHEAWLAALLRTPPEDAELFRHVEHGFLLLSHGERVGRYRPPHDHGAGWVIYAVAQGEIEMGTYGRVTDGGRTYLVRRETYRMRAGDARVYLPGDIHDTRCVSDSVLMLRFTSCDLKREAREGRLTRYVSDGRRFTAERP